jgi:hypothetical protein
MGLISPNGVSGLVPHSKGGRTVRYLYLLGLAAVWLVCGCGGGGGGNTLVDDGGGPLSFTPQAVVYPWEALTELPRNTPVAVVANQGGTQVRQYPALLQSSYLSGGSRISVCETAGSLQVGYGHSGTPIYALDGRMVGALFSGVDGSKSFFVRHMSEMLPMLEDGYVPLDAGRETPPATPWVLRGIPAAYTGTIAAQLTANRIIPLVGKASVPGRAAISPVPGSTIAVNFLDGDIAQLQAFGTLTYTPDGKRWVAFGHGLQYNGTCNLPVSMASVDTIAASAWGTYKLCHSVGPNIGALTRDHARGVVIDTRVTSPTTPIDTTFTYNGVSRTWHHRMARDRGSYLERYAARFGLVSGMLDLDNEELKSFGEATFTYTQEDGTPQTFYLTTYECDTPLYAAYELTNRISNLLDGATYGKAFTRLSLTATIKPLTDNYLRVAIREKGTDYDLWPDWYGNVGLMTDTEYVIIASVDGWTTTSLQFTIPEPFCTATTDGFKTNAGTGNSTLIVTAINPVTNARLSRTVPIIVYQKY